MWDGGKAGGGGGGGGGVIVLISGKHTTYGANSLDLTADGGDGGDATATAGAFGGKGGKRGRIIQINESARESVNVSFGIDGSDGLDS